jgi:hypothetical protein
MFCFTAVMILGASSAQAQPQYLGTLCGEGSFGFQPYPGSFAFTANICPTLGNRLLEIFMPVTWQGQATFSGLSMSGGEVVFPPPDSPPMNHWWASLPTNGGTLTFSGQTDGARFARITISAVPEPETYMIMLAGIAGLGFVARRRVA